MINNQNMKVLQLPHLELNVLITNNLNVTLIITCLKNHTNQTMNMSFCLLNITKFAYFFSRKNSLFFILMFLLCFFLNCTPDGNTPECAELEQQHKDDQQLFTTLYLSCVQFGRFDCSYFLLMLSFDERC